MVDGIHEKLRFEFSFVFAAVPQEDKLICGQCSFVCCDVKDFLEHKSTRKLSFRLYF